MIFKTNYQSIEKLRLFSQIIISSGYHMGFQGCGLQTIIMKIGRKSILISNFFFFQFMLKMGKTRSIHFSFATCCFSELVLRMRWRSLAGNLTKNWVDFKYFQKLFLNISKSYISAHLNSSRPNPGQIEKIKLNFYFHTSLWCLKRFYESLKGPQKSVKIKI